MRKPHHSKYSWLLFLAVLVPINVCFAQNQEEFSPEEIEEYELYYRFAATLYYDGGRVIKLADFHIGKDKFRHMFYCGINKGFMVPLSNIKRIERVRGGPDNRYTAVFLTDVEMLTTWDEADKRMLYGTLPDGKAWEGTIEGLRLVKISIIGENRKEVDEPEERKH